MPESIAHSNQELKAAMIHAIAVGGGEDADDDVEVGMVCVDDHPLPKRNYRIVSNAYVTYVYEISAN